MSTELSPEERETMAACVQREEEATPVTVGGYVKRGWLARREYSEQREEKLRQALEATCDAVRRICDEWVSENGVGPSSDWHAQRLLPLALRIEDALAENGDTDD